MDVVIQTINEGYDDNAIYHTLIKMAGIIKNFAPAPYIRGWATNIVRTVAPYHSFEEADAVYRFVQNKVRYTGDPLDWEYVHNPDVLLYQIEKDGIAYGDCDDFVVLGLTLLRSIGFPVAIKVVSYREDKAFTHVYGLVMIDGNWHPFDAIKADMRFGQEAELPITRWSIIDPDGIPSLIYLL